MKFTRTITVSLLIMLMSVVALGQRQTRAKTPPKPQPTPPARASVDTRRELIETKYDRFEDRTSVVLGPMPVKSTSPSRLEIGALFNHDGQTLLYPEDSIRLFIIATSKNFEFKDNQELFTLIDGQRERFGKMDYAYDVEPPSIVERMTMLISRDTLLKLANAKTVEMKVGSAEFQLENYHLAALRDIANRMIAVPAGVQPPFELTAFKFEKDELTGFMQVSGEVKNVSSTVIRSITAMIKCQSAEGTVVAESEAIVYRSNLNPQESSKFETSLPPNRQVKTCDVYFKKFLSGVIPHTKNLTP